MSAETYWVIGWLGNGVNTVAQLPRLYYSATANSWVPSVTLAHKYDRHQRETRPLPAGGYWIQLTQGRG